MNSTLISTNNMDIQSPTNEQMSNYMIDQTVELIADILGWNYSLTDQSLHGYTIVPSTNPGGVGFTIKRGSSTLYYRFILTLTYNSLSSNSSQINVNLGANNSTTLYTNRVKWQVGLNGDVAIWILGYNSNDTKKYPSLMVLNVSDIPKTQRSKVLIVSGSSGLYTTTTDELYNTLKTTNQEGTNILVDTDYDIISPFIVPNTPYIADNFYDYTNSLNITQASLLSDDVNQYITIVPSNISGSKNYILRVK